MDNQLPTKLCTGKAVASAALSALITAAVALTVCAAKGEEVTLGQAPHPSVSQSRTAALNGVV